MLETAWWRCRFRQAIAAAMVAPPSASVQPASAWKRFMPALSRLLATLAAMLAAVQPLAAQSILRDAETEALFHDMASPLVAAAGLDPRNVDIVLVGDPSLNAFVAGGQAG